MKIANGFCKQEEFYYQNILKFAKIDESEKIYILTHIAVLKVNKPPRETLLSSWFYTCVYMCMCVCVCFF